MKVSLDWLPVSLTVMLTACADVVTFCVSITTYNEGLLDFGDQI
jgi:hypothetical protein